MGDRRHRHAGRMHCRLQFLDALERARLEFLRNRRGPRRVLVEHANQFHGSHFAIDARVVAAEFPRANNSNTNSFAGTTHAPAHSFFPRESPAGSATSAGRNACTAIPAASANSMSFTRSKRRVRFASMARAVAPACFMHSTVGKPTTGTS